MFAGGLYGMADASWGDPWEQAKILAEEGVEILQLRCKRWSPEALADLARACRGLGVQVVVNDQVAVARQTGAWVHLGQTDGPDCEIPFGRSTHGLEDLENIGSAHYIGFGPVFASTTKAGVRSPRGLEQLREMVQRSPVPVIAIGGINLENIDAVRETGVHGWAVIGAIWGHPEPRQAIRLLTLKRFSKRST